MEDALRHEPVVTHTSRLQLPHPEMHRRRFVLAPLEEIAPDVRHPVLGRTVRELLLGLPSEDQTGEQVVRLAGRAAS
jgi:7,8-dihydro-6-hydroxymethylpterin-pyrophosphokinase